MSKAEWNETAAGSFSVVCHCSAGWVATGLNQKSWVCPVQGRGKTEWKCLRVRDELDTLKSLLKTKTNLECCNIIRTFEVRSEVSIYPFPIAAHHHRRSRGRAGAGGYPALRSGRLTMFIAARRREENQRFRVRPINSERVSPTASRRWSSSKEPTQTQGELTMLLSVDSWPLFYRDTQISEYALRFKEPSVTQMDGVTFRDSEMSCEAFQRERIGAFRCHWKPTL